MGIVGEWRVYLASWARADSMEERIRGIGNLPTTAFLSSTDLNHRCRGFSRAWYYLCTAPEKALDTQPLPCS